MDDVLHPEAAQDARPDRAAAPRRAHDGDRPLRVDPVGHGADRVVRDVHRARHVALGPFGGLANVEHLQGRIGSEGRGQVGGGHPRDRLGGPAVLLPGRHAAAEVPGDAGDADGGGKPRGPAGVLVIASDEHDRALGARQPPEAGAEAGVQRGEAHRSRDVRLIELPLGIVGVAMGTVLIPEVTRAVRGGDHTAVAHAESRGLELAVASGNRTIEAALTLQFAQIARLRGDLAQARARVAEGLALVVTPRVPMLQFAGVILFAELLAAAGEVGCAHALIAFVAGHPDVSAPVRDEAHARRARLPAPPGPVPAWPGLTLEALLDRIVGEAPLDHAPLLAALRGAA